MADREASPIPLEIRARLAELELELSEGKKWIKKTRGVRGRKASPLLPLLLLFLLLFLFSLVITLSHHHHHPHREPVPTNGI